MPPILSRRRRVPGFAALAFALAGCATNPATGEKQFSLISESQEIQMGRQADLHRGEHGARP
jgi:hypothetical protein